MSSSFVIDTYSWVEYLLGSKAGAKARDYSILRLCHSDSNKRVGTRFSSEIRESQVTNMARSTIATAKM